jgi:diketogulonate reductase-like aldo/keto reductase
MTPAQAALAWLLARDDLMVIPKTSSRARLRENVGALDILLDDAQRAELDRLFPPPKGPSSLAML